MVNRGVVENQTKPTQNTVYMREQFEAFIKTIKSGQVAHWQDVASAVGVSRQTIVEWKKLPEAQEAIKQGLDHALSQMEVAGKKDWRMWEAKLKMLGINPASKLEVGVVNITEQILKQFGIIPDDGKNKEITQSPPKD